MTTFQWFDWRPFRFASVDSREYREAVSQLAVRLVDANAVAGSPSSTEAAIALAETTDEQDGDVDLMAKAEATLPEWSETVNAIGAEIQSIGELMQVATEEVTNPKVNTFAQRLLVIRRLASELMQPSSSIARLGEAFTNQLHDVDLGITTIIEKLPAEIEADASASDTVASFVTSIREMVAASDTGLSALGGLIEAIAPIEKMSRDLRPPMKDLRHGLTLMLEGKEVLLGWVALMDSLDLGSSSTSNGSQSTVAQ